MFKSFVVFMLTAMALSFLHIAVVKTYPKAEGVINYGLVTIFFIQISEKVALWVTGKKSLTESEESV